MENNFYVGIVCHKKRIINSIVRERRVLYNNNIYYIDLEKNREYTTDNSLSEYVDSSTLVLTDINDYNIDYAYLLAKYKSKKLVRRR